MARKSVGVDPAVSRFKFDKELAEFYKLHDDHIRRGWWIVKDTWPEIFVVFGIHRLKPPAVLFGALLDFTDYDFLPPSLKLVDPFTREPYKAKDVPSSLLRSVRVQPPPGIEAALAGVVPPGVRLQAQPQAQPLVQAYAAEDIPFVCLPGTYEYHTNPGHTGDSWFLHRHTGAEGTLYFLLNALYQYGVLPITDYGVQLTVRGFVQSEVPE